MPRLPSTRDVLAPKVRDDVNPRLDRDGGRISDLKGETLAVLLVRAVPDCDPVASDGHDAVPVQAGLVQELLDGPGKLLPDPPVEEAEFSQGIRHRPLVQRQF